MVQVESFQMLKQVVHILMTVVARGKRADLVYWSELACGRCDQLRWNECQPHGHDCGLSMKSLITTVLWKNVKSLGKLGYTYVG